MVNVIRFPSSDYRRVVVAADSLEQLCVVLRAAISPAATIDDLLRLSQLAGALSRELARIEDLALAEADAR